MLARHSYGVLHDDSKGATGELRVDADLVRDHGGAIGIFGL